MNAQRVGRDEPRAKTKARLRAAARVLAALVVALGVYATAIEPRQLVVREEEIALAAWRGPPLRVALLSDLHVGSPHWGLERTRDLVAQINAKNPDVILLAGDYVIDGVLLGTKVAAEAIAEVLAGLHARFGVFAVLGNHDWWNDGARVRGALAAKGITVLENEVGTFVHGDAPIAVAGLADPMTRSPRPEQTFAAAPEGAPVIALVHGPDVFPSIGARPAITLAGHTHGGQVRLPLVGRLVVPSKYGQRYAAGHVVEGGRHLFVTTGVGTSIVPVRLGVPPEVVMLVLRNGR